MSEPTPITVPSELQALSDHDPDVIAALRGARVVLEQRSSLGERDIELVRFGALIALGAPAGSFRSHVKRALADGMTAAEIWSTVTAVATIVGVPRLLEVTPHIAAALEATESESH